MHENEQGDDMKISEFQDETVVQTLQGLGQALDVTLQQGSRGEDVKALQQLLNQKGFIQNDGKQLTVDGIFGANTAAAVRWAQEQGYATRTGVVDANTRKLIQTMLDGPKSFTFSYGADMPTYTVTNGVLKASTAIINQGGAGSSGGSAGAGGGLVAPQGSFMERLKLWLAKPESTYVLIGAGVAGIGLLWWLMRPVPAVRQMAAVETVGLDELKGLKARRAPRRKAVPKAAPKKAPKAAPKRGPGRPRKVAKMPENPI
jgi:hypothetical protein